MCKHTAASCWLLLTLSASTTSFSSKPISIKAMTACGNKEKKYCLFSSNYNDVRSFTEPGKVSRVQKALSLRSRISTERRVTAVQMAAMLDKLIIITMEVFGWGFNHSSIFGHALEQHSGRN